MSLKPFKITRGKMTWPSKEETAVQVARCDHDPEKVEMKFYPTASFNYKEIALEPTECRGLAAALLAHADAIDPA